MLTIYFYSTREPLSFAYFMLIQMCVFFEKEKTKKHLQLQAALTEKLWIAGVLYSILMLFHGGNTSARIYLIKLRRKWKETNIKNHLVSDFCVRGRKVERQNRFWFDCEFLCF